MEFYHVPVLRDECIESLNIRNGGIIVDGTIGGAGHSSVIAEKLSGSGRLIGIDQDSNAICAAKKRLENFENVTFVNTNFKYIKEILSDFGIDLIIFSLKGVKVNIKNKTPASNTNTKLCSNV